jgi:hypothetical protein
MEVSLAKTLYIVSPIDLLFCYKTPKLSNPDFDHPKTKTTQNPDLITKIDFWTPHKPPGTQFPLPFPESPKTLFTVF